MIVQLHDSDTGTAMYINSDFVATLRPDPEDPTHVTVVKLKDGETIRVRGEHAEVADRLSIASVTA